MDLLDAVEHESIDEVRRIFGEGDLPESLAHFDYELLNKALECGKTDTAKYLLSEKNCRVNRGVDGDQGSSTPLHHAVKLEDPELVRMLLLRSASVTRADSKGNTPLHLAFLRDAEEIIQLLIGSIGGSQTHENPRNQHGLTHLHIACTRRTDESRVIHAYVNDNESRIDAAVSPDSPKWKGFTALHFAAAYRSASAIAALLSHDKCTREFLTTADHEGLTPEQLVSVGLGDFQTMACKLRDKLNPTPGDAIGGETPLHRAVREGLAIRVEQLLSENNVDIEATDDRSATPLHLALYREFAEGPANSIVELLYASFQEKFRADGVLKNRKDDNGLGYLHVAVSRNDVEMVERFLQLANAEVNSPVRLNSRAFSYFAPLHFAVRYGHREMAELLIERGADVNQTSADGTALHIACDLGRHEIVETLLRSQADVNVARASDGKTALHLLVGRFASQPTTNTLLTYIQQLMDAGAEVNVADKNGRTALHQNPKGLFIKDFAVCIELLLRNGADVNAGGGFAIETHDDSSTEGCRVFCDHVLNLQVLRLRITPTVRAAFNVLMQVHDENWLGRDAIAQKEAEGKRMRDTELWQGVKLYDFLRLEPRRAALLANKVKTLIEAAEFRTHYPKLGYLVKLHHDRAKAASRCHECSNARRRYSANCEHCAGAQ